MLVISLIAFAQYTQKDQPNIDETFISQSDDQMFDNEFQFELNIEEQDESFEFDTLDYLPSDFNAYSEDESILAALELLNEEEDAPFEFNSKKYIPLGFNPNCQYELSEIFEVEIEEENASFDFDTKMYLPENFNPYSNTNTIGELAQL